MKRTARKSLRSGLAFVLTLCMMLSLCGAAFAVEDEAAPSADSFSAEVSDILSEMYEVLEKYGPDVTDDAVWAYADEGEYNEELIASLKVISKYFDNAVNDFLSAQYPETAASLRTEMTGLLAKLTDTKSALRTQLLDKLEEISKGLNAQLAGVEDPDLKAALAAKLQPVDDEIKAVEALVQKYIAAIDEMCAKINAINEKLDRVNDTLEDAIDNIKNFKSMFDAVAASDSGYEALAANGESYARKLYNLYKDARTLYDDLQTTCDDAAALLRQASDDVKSTRDEIKALYKSLTSDIPAVRDALKPFLQIMKEDIQSIAQQDSVQNAEGLSATVDALQKEFDAHVKEVLDAAAAAADEANKDYQAQRNEIRKELERMYDELNAVTDVPQELQDSHDYLVNHEKALQKELDALREQMRDASSDARALIETHIEEVQAEINDAQASIVELDAEIQRSIENSKKIRDELADFLSFYPVGRRFQNLPTSSPVTTLMRRGARLLVPMRNRPSSHHSCPSSSRTMV